MRARFTDLDIMPAEKAHDFTADYMVRVPDDQWKYAVSKRHTTMFLQALFFLAAWMFLLEAVECCPIRSAGLSLRLS